MKLDNKDIIVSDFWGRPEQKSSWVVRSNIGICVYHKPTDTTVRMNNQKKYPP